MNKKRIKLEYQIIHRIFIDNGNSVHFNYRVNIDTEKYLTLEVYTYNHKHDSMMFLIKVEGISSINCLDKVIKFLDNNLHDEFIHSYSIKWSNSNGIYTSYVYAENEEEACHKIHLGDKNELRKILIVTLNPIS